MATVPREGLPAFWCTAIAKALVGENPCYLSPWLSGHYKLEKRPRDESSLVIWKANHTELLKMVIDQFRNLGGWKCSVEKFWKVTGQTAIISGKADLIAQKTDYRPVVIDAKGGSPRDSDVAQVQIQMITIPLAWNAPGMQFDGEVHYPTHVVKVPHKDAEALKPKLFALLRSLGAGSARPAASPGERTCLYCDVSSTDCPDRYSGDAEPDVMTTEW